jgi:hypothetical protein
MTTNMPNLAKLMADVQSASAALEIAQADVALMQRLRTAEADAKRLTAELEIAQHALIEANTDAVLVARSAAFANFEDITVTQDDRSGGHILHLGFNIEVTRKAWDGRTTGTETVSYNSFTALPRDVLAYLIEVHPDRIPAGIMALAPNNAHDAFQEYFMGQRRGYMIGVAA